MKAAVFYGKGDIRVDEHYPMPEVGPESVLIQVKACGVCGTVCEAGIKMTSILGKVFILPQ